MSNINIKYKSSISMGANCYSISDGNKYIIVDPIIKYNIMDSISNGKIAGVLITHGHFDHFEELRSYLENTDIDIYCHKNCLEKLQSSIKNCSKLLGHDLVIGVNDRFKVVKNGEQINLLNIPVFVKETFGHTNCSLTYIIDDNMFTGDFLFKGSIGRTDLYTGNASIMNENLSKLKKINKDYNIYPGHGIPTKLFNELTNNIYLK